MKNIIKHSIIVSLFFATVNVYGQTTPPEKVTLETSKDYYRHGFNSKGTNTTNPDGSAVIKPEEVRDSVTVTSTIKYFVLPDKNSNPDFKYDNITNANDYTKVLSTFDWGLRRSPATPILGTIVAPTGFPDAKKHVIEVTWGSTVGIDTVRVKENPANGCSGLETKIPVEIIAKPTITFNQVTQPDASMAYTDFLCVAQDPATVNVTYNFPVTFASSVLPSAQVWVDYTVTREDGETISPSLNQTNIPLVLDQGKYTFPITFNKYGKYIVTITKVTDRIARKSNVSSTGAGLLTSGGSATFTYNVMKTVQTGPIYRLPNNGNY